MNERLLMSVVLAASCVAGCGSGVREARDRAQMLAARAAQASNAGECERARSLSQEAVNLKPDFAEAWVTQGISCAVRGDEATARGSYERALQLHAQRYRRDPGDAKQLQQQVYLFLLLRREPEARALLAHGLKAHPADRQLPLFAAGLESLLADEAFNRLRVPDG